MRRLGPGIHAFVGTTLIAGGMRRVRRRSAPRGAQDVDGRDEPGHDGEEPGRQLHPVVLPQVSHFRQVPFLTMVKLAHSGQASPT